MAKLTPQQLTQLGDDFLAFAQALGNYRIANRATLSKKQNEKIKNIHWTLLNYADDFYTTSAINIIAGSPSIPASLVQITEVTKNMDKAYQTISKIQKVIDVATAGVTLAASIFSTNPQAIINALAGLTKTLK